MGRLDCVLLVDDSNATNDLTSFHLKKNGICEKIVVKNNGNAALEYLASGEGVPDLLLLDINMPVMDGFEFLESYETLPLKLKESIVVILLTSSSDSKDIERIRDNKWVSDYYQKPLGKENLFEILEKFF